MNNVISRVVANDLCIGCGMCAAVCPSHNLGIRLNQQGTYEPFLEKDQCDDKGNCLKVCPFNPFPEKKVATEDAILSTITKENDSPNYSKSFGGYNSLYVGYAKEYRREASSGGIATWLLKQLLKHKIVDKIIATIENDKDDSVFYKYTIIDTIEDINLTSKTKYYPMHIGDIARLIKGTNESYAIIGLPCTIKAIRLAQVSEPENWKTIKFCISIFCGGLKSTFFTEYLASKIDVRYDEIIKPEYRVKNINSTAGDYSFSCSKKGDDNTPLLLPMKKVGDMWGTGYFKPNPCDFCEDLSGELADISLGDAWIPPYNKDGAGHSLIITRTQFAEQLISTGMSAQQLICDGIHQKQASLSQEGNYNHRRVGLSYRLKWAKKRGDIIPPKRTRRIWIENPLKSKIFKLRQKLQKESTIFWIEERIEKGKNFEEKISKTKAELAYYTKIEHLFRKKYWIRKLIRK
ncbi:Coenzyme F420 hydrogenase/dehydrogenase, beta subunit C-terminal domain [Aquimarina longa]|uniref:Coenzyme F420 hydrogenase/dehydrogenase, beta subunit C-terminal domain n=1 Tax=Aquimarina longa TaxID=1080221 RepID=UPI000783357F|nr:Coenzyme F420 hydrogenase/dehydrogenase, beta subunit C-terminal domain [Aquimarina longa]